MYDLNLALYSICFLCIFCLVKLINWHDFSNFFDLYYALLVGSIFRCSVLCRYCPECKVDTSKVVLAGEKLKESKKKAKMPSAQSTASRDWGKVTTNKSGLKF